MSFVRNAWYVAGWSTDFGDDLVPLTLLAQNLVVYRTSEGQIAALYLCLILFLIAIISFCRSSKSAI